MYCPKCGFECTETDKFCKNCGNKLVELQDTEKNIIQSDVNEYRDDENNESMIKCPYCYSPVPRHVHNCFFEFFRYLKQCFTGRVYCIFNVISYSFYFMDIFYSCLDCRNKKQSVNNSYLCC